MATFDAETVLSAARLDPRRTEVVAVTTLDDYAAALVADTTDESQRVLELFRLAEDGTWVNAASGDVDGVTDGRAVARWDAEGLRLVLGYADAPAGSATVPRSEPAKGLGGPLLWVFLQSLLLWPAVAGAYVWNGPRPGLVFLSFQAVMIAVIPFLIVRNLVRLWGRGSRADASRGIAITLAVCGLILTAASTVPLLRDGTAAALPTGVVWLVVGLNLLALAARELVRTRSATQR